MIRLYLPANELEPTNIAYSLSKIAGYMMCKKYTEQYGFETISVMPNNLYGINDNFNPNECHVIPSFINRFIEAKENHRSSVVCFGDGTPTREFLFSDDLADGLLFLMNNYNDPEIINIGPNREVSIKELTEIIKKIKGSGVTIILIEHHMDVVMSVCDIVTVLDFGQKIAEGTPAEIQGDTRVIEAYLGSSQEDTGNAKTVTGETC